MSSQKREALTRAARYILAALRRKAPTEKSAESLHIDRRSDEVWIRSRDLGAWATEINARHPVYGNRRNWAETNKYHPGRTGWATRAIDEAADRAVEQFADEYLRRIAIESPIFERTGQ